MTNVDYVNYYIQALILTADEITTVCPTSRPFNPACILMEFVQKTANSPIYSLYIHPAS